ncbi:MAG: NADH-quinone oxidoreductase subunit C [Candidatus Methanomethylophilaceae archaeon]|nr:NADH-quinone oxidoreductase subunit C [Candidatus Methanomethylophilaceae archaeon]MDD3378506.1 NADH-quinone oxidoreductase subunit C [Candidatus Methanomethylophilaceae archaeon]MDY0224426.1 NADH-quinone oxidoreductase subunit C [Candidatus Methanomethylophilaceae archaeon]
MTRSHEVQEITEISYSDLLVKAKELAEGGYRAVQICATSKDGKTEMLYSFDKDFKMINYRVNVPSEMRVSSITGFFWSAFIFENEVHDLFGIEFTDLVLDYKGNFFKLSSKTPWKTEAKKEVQ